MSETEKQEGQKTVVAFIAGLLIGGLLVWVFSSAPADAPTNNTANTIDTSEEVDDNDSETSDRTTTTNDTSEAEDTTANTKGGQTTGEGSINVANQPAGNSVALGNVSFPTNEGWVVVRDYANGVSGRILGASRFNLPAGLVPEAVQLLRATESGKTYEVVFYTENGDRVFDVATDKQMAGSSDTFSAQ